MHVREGEDYDHQQPPFDMPGGGEQVVLPSGERFGGSFGRVLWLLFESARRGFRYHLGGNTYGRPGEVPTWAIRHMWAGGTAGDRRARQLHQEYGLPIASRLVPTGGGRGSAVGVYVYQGVFEGVSIRAKVTKRRQQPVQPRPAPARLSTPLPDRRPAPVAVPQRALEGVKVAVLWPHETDREHVDLEETRAAPSGGLVGELERGLPPWEADSRYREELMERVRSGELVEQLRELNGRAVLCPRIGQWTPATVLRAVVDMMGAVAA